MSCFADRSEHFEWVLQTQQERLLTLEQLVRDWRGIAVGTGAETRCDARVWQGLEKRTEKALGGVVA